MVVSIVTGANSGIGRATAVRAGLAEVHDPEGHVDVPVNHACVGMDAVVEELPAGEPA